MPVRRLDIDLLVRRNGANPDQLCCGASFQSCSNLFKALQQIWSDQRSRKTRSCRICFQLRLLRWCPRPHNDHHDAAGLGAESAPHTYDVGGRQCSESMRSHGNTSAGSGYKSCAFPERYLFISRVVEWLKPSLALTLRCFVRHRWTVVRTCTAH